MIERKAGVAVTFEAKAVGEAGDFEAYVSDWQTDRGRDRVMPGAFTKSLGARPAVSVKMLRDHDPTRLCGTWLAFTPDSRGLHAKGRLILESREGADAYALMKAGALDACSIGYLPIRARKDHAKGERILEEIDLRECSLVTWGMNEGALVSSVKHSLHNPDEARRLVAALNRATAALKQARIAFEEAMEMIRLDGRLMDRTRVRDTVKRIEHLGSRSVYTAISAEADSAHGQTPAYLAIDELHVWPGYSLWNALKTGASKVAGSLTVITTTAGERAEGVCWELFKYALDVHAGRKVDPTFLPIIFAADPKADWLDEDLWHMVNPGLAAGFPDLDSLRSESQLAREVPALAAGFRQTHLNIWSDGTTEGWIEASAYDEGAAPVDLDALAGRPAAVGIDMSRTHDMTGLVVAVRDEDGGYTVVPFAFLPETAFRKRSQTHKDFDWRGWRESGALTVLSGDIIDEEVIEAKVKALCKIYDVQVVGFDPKFAGRLMGRLMADDVPVLECPQTPSHLSPFYVEMQRAMIARKFRHGGSPVLRHAVLNAIPHTFENGLFYLSKKRSGAAIDVAVACGMAVGLISGDAPAPNYFEDKAFDPQFLVLS